MPKFIFSEKEICSSTRVFSRGRNVPLFNAPATPKEGYIAMLKREPIWQITGVEEVLFCPKVIPDNAARAQVFDAEGLKHGEKGGKDMFGIEWEYVPMAGGSMVRPGKPFLLDANEWYKKVVWPDVDSWDWEGAAKVNRDYLKPEFFNQMWILNGWYERLISFMEFEGAIMAMADEDQQDAVKALFMRLSDLYIDIIDHAFAAFPNLDCIFVHDDWGSQKETFFSPALVREMIVPAMKKVTDHVHSLGKYTRLHSCGQLYKQVPNMIEAGWDIWSGQAINDTHKIYEEYGDRIIVGVMPDQYDPLTASDDEQRACADVFIDKFCSYEKPCIVNICALDLLTDAYREQLYRKSREKLAK